MTTCRNARAILDESVRGEADETSLLSLEEHLGRCEECREERARLLLLTRLRRAPEQHLDEAAHARILRQLRLEAAAPQTTRWHARPWRLLRRPLLLVSLAAACVLAIALRGTSAHPPEIAEEKRSNVVLADRTELSMPAAGSLDYAGSTVRYTAGTRVVIHGGERTLELVAGSVDIDVVPGHGRYRVETPKFAVEVLGTRFVVKAGSVETLRGLVRVETPTGTPLALVHAGERWDVPREPAPTPALEVSPPPRVPKSAAIRRAAPTMPEAATLLRDSRSALARRDFELAEETLAAARAAARSDAVRAQAEFLAADLLRLQGRGAEAIDAYRSMVTRWPRESASEQGRFLVGELLLEQGRRDEAREALEGYLAAHPEGAFVEEARALLGHAARENGTGDR